MAKHTRKITGLTVGVVVVNGREEIRIRHEMRHHTEYLTARTYYTGPDGKQWPGHSGIRLEADRLPEVLRMIENALTLVGGRPVPGLACVSKGVRCKPR